MKKIYKTNLIKCAALTLLALSSFSTSNAQDGDKRTDATNFEEMRMKEFSKLIGGPTQTGVNMNYNSEKAAIEGASTFNGSKIPKGHLFQVKGSVGTSTNLSELFSQKVLPSFSGSFSWNVLLRGRPSRWFYDGRFDDNYAELKTGTLDVSAIDAGTYFSYKQALKDKVKAGSLDPRKHLYSFKRFTWVSLTGKYENTKYAFYDADRIFAEQLYEPIYQSWSGKLALNGFYTWNKEDFKWKRYRLNFIYFNLAVQYGLGNNIQQLKKKTINDVSATQTEGGITRQILKSNSAYTGTYKEFSTLTPSFDLIVSPIKSFAINTFGEYNLIGGKDKTKNGIDNYGSIAAGGYFYGTETVKINIGVYYKWTRNSVTDTWTEQIGLRTTIPITPN